jgi:hypothetical protein
MSSYDPSLSDSLGSITNDTPPDAGIVEAARDYLGSSEGGEAATAGALSWLAGVLREEAADRLGDFLTLKGLSHEMDSAFDDLCG